MRTMAGQARTPEAETGEVAYYLIALPNVLLVVVGLALALFPLLVARLESARFARAVVATCLSVTAIITWSISAYQLRAGDQQIAELERDQHTNFHSLSQQIASFQEATPKIPNLAVHWSDELALAQVGQTLLLAVNVRLTNDGDDAVIAHHFISGIGLTPDINEIKKNTKKMRGMLPALMKNEEAVPVRHGESIVASGNIPVDANSLGALRGGANTAYFAAEFDVKTKTGKHQTFVYCSFYQGMMLVIC